MKAWNGFLARVDGDQTCGLSKKTTKRMLHVHQLPAPGSVLQETEQKIFISGLGVNICVSFLFCFVFFFRISFFDIFLFLSTTGAKHQQERDCV